jgi:hypothetical protein
MDHKLSINVEQPHPFEYHDNVMGMLLRQAFSRVYHQDDVLTCARAIDPSRISSSMSYGRGTYLTDEFYCEFHKIPVWMVDMFSLDNISSWGIMAPCPTNANPWLTQQ